MKHIDTEIILSSAGLLIEELPWIFPQPTALHNSIFTTNQWNCILGDLIQLCQFICESKSQFNCDSNPLIIDTQRPDHEFNFHVFVVDL